MRTLFLLLITLSVCLVTGCYYDEPEPTESPQPTAAFWAKTYGGAGSESGNAIQETSDQGFLVFGNSDSFGANGYDSFVLKLDTEGELAWSKTFGGSNDDWASTGKETLDGGFIMGGQTASFGAGDNNDAWIVKRSGAGIISWQKRFQLSDSGVTAFTDIIQTSDNNFIAVGAYQKISTARDGFIMKFDENGGVIWQKGFGGGNMDIFISVQQTIDNGYILVGSTASRGYGSYDGWVIKVNSTGNLEWLKVIGSTGGDSLNSIQQTTDQGFIMTGYYQPTLEEDFDLWIIKMDVDGEFEWQYCYGGDSEEVAYDVRQVPDGGYIVCGYTTSPAGNDYDNFVLKLSNAGAIEWQKTYGGTGDDRTQDIQITSDGGYIVTGYTESYGTERELWVLKLNESGECPPLDTDLSLGRYEPSPGVTSPTDVELADTMSEADTACVVNENPEVTVTSLIP